MVTPPPPGPWVFAEELGGKGAESMMVEDLKETVFYKVSGQLHTGTHGSYDSTHESHVSSRRTNSQWGVHKAPPVAGQTPASDGCWDGESQASLVLEYLVYRPHSRAGLTTSSDQETQTRLRRLGSRGGEGEEVSGVGARGGRCNRREGEART